MKPSLQRLFAIAWLTVRTAIRLRVVIALAALLILCVVLLPFCIKHNGTARMFTQVLLSYSLYLCSGLLGLATLWIACGTHATDVDPGQLQLLAVKPAARWQIWLGRWLGVMTLNVLLLAGAGATAGAMLQWQARRLEPAQQQILAREILVARASARETPPDLDADVDAILARRAREESLAHLDPDMVRREIRDQLRARHEIIAPNFRRLWDVPLPVPPARLAGQPLQLRVRFHAAALDRETARNTVWVIGRPESGRSVRLPKQLTALAHHEFEIPPDLVDPDGRLHVECENRDQISLLFPLADGLEVLFPYGGFVPNFARALLVIAAWLALLAALGLTAASFLPFIVATLFALTLLGVSLSGDTFAAVLQDGTLLGLDHETGQAHSRALDRFALPVYRALNAFARSFQGVSPIDALSQGRAIPWPEVASALARIVALAGGITAAAGLLLFSRRELAREQVAA